MGQIKKFPCLKCHKLSDGIITYFQEINENCFLIKFKMNCCGITFCKIWNAQQVERYARLK